MKVEEIMEGSIGTIKAETHRIKLVEGVNLLFQPPYRAGPTRRPLEKTETDKMIEIHVI